MIPPVYAQFDDEFQEDFFSDETEKKEEQKVPELEPVPETEAAPAEVKETVKEEKKQPQEEAKPQRPVEEKPAVTPQEETAEPVFDTPVEENRASTIQNAIIEGIQISKEPGDTPDESIITCYFIFRDKPTSYFYETKQKQKSIEFEFNDVITGTSPIPSVSEPPIQGFVIEKRKVDANKDVVGLNPEWHDIIKVKISFDAFPKITVKDEYSVISFSFRWTSSADKEGAYTEKDNKGRKVVIIALLGAAGLSLGGVGAYLYINKDGDDVDPVRKPLDSIEGIIVHPNPDGR